PNTDLGVIPLGKDQQNIPLKHISGATLSTKYNYKKLLIGLFLAFIGLIYALTSLVGLTEDFFGALVAFVFSLLVAAVGVGIAGSGMQTLLIIEKAGNPYIIEVPFFEKSKMSNLNNTIENGLADDTDKTDLNLFFDKKQTQ